MKIRKSCGIVLFRKKQDHQEYLVLKYPPELDYWGLCRGTVEPNETEEQTALREAYEETSLRKIRFISGFKEKINYFFIENGKQIPKEVTFFLGEVFDDNEGKISQEHEKLEWLPYSLAIKKIKHKKDQEVVRKAEERLNLNN